MKIDKDKLIDGAWYFVEAYNNNYLMKFEKITEESDYSKISVYCYYYHYPHDVFQEKKCCNWANYNTIDILREATDFELCEFIPGYNKIINYEIY